MPYQIKDAEGHFRYITDRMPVDSLELAQEYVRVSERDFKSVCPEWFPFAIVEVK